MDLEEAKNIILEGDHAVVTYELAVRTLAANDNPRLAFYGRKIALLQRQIVAVEAQIKKLRERASVERKPTAKGTKEDIVEVVSSHHGIYAPQYFTQRFTEEYFEHTIDSEDWRVVNTGPENDDYWEAWTSIEMNARIVMNPFTWEYEPMGRNIEFMIYTYEGDIYLVPTDLTPEDMDDLFGG